ncbi:MAG TPA: Gfo/Idh/MocA family oxidoreductase [Planctomycetes bacterium]|nr:Gfo/Idh/MocA family oxidoreductase [Planctomycetota bacterium]
MIHIAVIGCGYWGPNLIRNFSALPDCTVTHVCDLDAARLARAKALYPHLRTTSRASEILDNPRIDAVAIATPVATHFELGARSLTAGKHTLIEKPLATSVEHCQQLIRLAEQQQRVLMVGHTFLYSTAVEKIKQLVDAGDLGEILYISSQRLNLGLFQTDINVTWDLAPHDLSILLHLLGCKPVSVNCQGKAHVHPQIEDVTNMSLSFPRGTFAMIQSSWLDPSKVRRMTVVGSRKMVLYDDTEPLEKVKIYDKRVEVPPHYDSYAEFHYSYHYGDMYVPHLKQVEPLKAECQDFLKAIRTGEPPRVTGQQGLAVVAILQAADHSLRHGGIPVELTDPLVVNSYGGACLAAATGSTGQSVTSAPPLSPTA